MASKDVRKLIITLIILAIGIKIITIIAGGFTSNLAIPSALPNLSSSLSAISDLVIIGIIILVVILIPVYLSKRSEEKGLKGE